MATTPDTRIYHHESAHEFQDTRTLTTTIRGELLPFYTRAFENPSMKEFNPQEVIPYNEVLLKLENSELSDGGRDITQAVLERGYPQVFKGGGAGLNFEFMKGPYLPSVLTTHAMEASAYIKERKVDVLLAPGKSGHSFGMAYGAIAEIPVVRMRKEEYDPEKQYPVYAFTLPGYSSQQTDVHFTSPFDIDIVVSEVLSQQLAEQDEEGDVRLELFLGIADDIIDKAKMALAVGKHSVDAGELAMKGFIQKQMRERGDHRIVTGKVGITGMVTPVMKGYTSAETELKTNFGISPFAGITITGIYPEANAIGIKGLGIAEFAPKN